MPRGVTLTPGDVFSSGGARLHLVEEHLRPPESFPGWLHDGDVVTLQVEGWARQADRPGERLLFRWLFGRRSDSDYDRREVNPAPTPGYRLPAGTKSPTGYGRGRCPTELRLQQRRAGRRDGASLLVDTLFDLALTYARSAAMKPVAGGAHHRRPDHALNGDHTALNCWTAQCASSPPRAPPRRSGMAAPEMLAGSNRRPGPCDAVSA